MKTLQNIANLITVRNFLSSSIDNESIKLSKDDFNKVRACVKTFDKSIIELSLKLDLSLVGKEPATRTISRSWHAESTEDTETVMKKFTVNDPANVPSQPKNIVSGNVVVDHATGMTAVKAPADENTEST